jgi:hypothetical protein
LPPLLDEALVEAPALYEPVLLSLLLPQAATAITETTAATAVATILDLLACIDSS